MEVALPLISNGATQPANTVDVRVPDTPLPLPEPPRPGHPWRLHGVSMTWYLRLVGFSGFDAGGSGTNGPFTVSLVQNGLPIYRFDRWTPAGFTRSATGGVDYLASDPGSDSIDSPNEVIFHAGDQLAVRLEGRTQAYASDWTLAFFANAVPTIPNNNLHQDPMERLGSLAYELERAPSPLGGGV